MRVFESERGHGLKKEVIQRKNSAQQLATVEASVRDAKYMWYAERSVG